MKEKLLFLLFVTFFVITQNQDVSEEPQDLATPENKNPKNIFIFRHLSKTGGTFLRNALPKIIQGEPSPKTPTNEKAWKNEGWYVNDRLIFISDRVEWEDDLRANTMKNSFVLLTMRHPCSWYRSYYHYRPQEPLKQNRITSRPQRSLNEYVNAIMLDTSFGYMSYRFWKAYVAPKNCYFFRYVDATRDENGDCSIKRAKSELSSLEPQKLAHCWMLTSNLFSNLADCLKSWDNLSVNWTEFNSIASSNASAEVREKQILSFFIFSSTLFFFFCCCCCCCFVPSQKKNQIKVFGGELKDPRRNQTDSCATEYSQATHELIQEADKELFRLFQIPSCCVDPSDSLSFPFGEANEIATKKNLRDRRMKFKPKIPKPPKTFFSIFQKRARYVLSSVWWVVVLSYSTILLGFFFLILQDKQKTKNFSRRD